MFRVIKRYLGNFGKEKKELEEKKRCDIARQNKLIKSQKKLSLGRFFHGLF